MFPCPRNREPNLRMGSPWSCRRLYSSHLANSMFSSRTASCFIAARTSVSGVFARLFPAVRVKSLRRSSSQHSKSSSTRFCSVIPVAATYSSHRAVKYVQSWPVPAADTTGRRTLSPWITGLRGVVVAAVVGTGAGAGVGAGG